jgi:hypothetical protein
MIVIVEAHYAMQCGDCEDGFMERLQNNGLSFFWGMLTVAAGWIICEYIEGRFKSIVRFRNRTIL